VTDRDLPARPNRVGIDWVSCGVLSVLLGLLVLAPAERPFAEERLLLDRRLETLRRILPDGPLPAADTAHLRSLAESAHLSGVQIQARSPETAGTRGQIAYDLKALGGYGEIDLFFGQVALSHRLIDVESLTLTSTPESVVQLAATLRLPFWPPSAPLPPPPEDGRPKGVPRPTLEAFRADQALALAKTQAIASWRRARRNPRLFLSELAAAVRDRPVVLGYASLGDTFTVRGLSIGESTMQGLQSRFEQGFFRVSDFLMARQGACHRFEVHGTSPVAGPEAELPLALNDPFVQDTIPCRVDRDPPERLVVSGPRRTAKNPGAGPLTLRLRDVDFADVFRALSLVSGQGFVVDADVLGRVDLEVTRVTLEETLDLISRQTKVEIAEPGPVRRVSRTPPAPAPPALGGGGTAAVSFALKRAEVRELLALMSEIDPELATLGPAGPLGRLSVWVGGVSLGELRRQVLAAAGLTERLEDDSRVLERVTGSAGAPVPVAEGPVERRLALGPEEVAVLEFDLAGVASGGAGWMAFAYSPSGQLHSYRVGDPLADALVRAIQSTDVLLETSEGPLRIGLTPPGS
jgi:hypothetical protein